MSRDYMMALQQRFHIKSEETTKAGHEVEAAYDALHDELSREQKKLLLRYLDAEEAFRNEEKLDCFFSGFRLTRGIEAELNSVPPYSFDDEGQATALEILKREWAEKDQD